MAAPRAGRASGAPSSWLRAVPALAIAALAVLAMLVPPQMLAPLDLVGYAVCHRIPARSFFVDGSQLPVCTRDTGMFSAALIGLAAFAFFLRERASHFPARPYTIVFALCFLAWALDGVNSYFALVTGREMLYPPQNWLRLATGAAMGVALSAYVAALFNQAVWAQPAESHTIASWRGVAGLAVVALGVVAVVLWRPDFLYGPIAMVSVLGVICMLTIVNGLLVLIVLRRHGRTERWSELTLPLLAGLVLTLAEVAAIVALRFALTGSLDLPY